MKTINMILLLFLGIFFVSCDKSDVESYEQKAGVYFSSTTYSFSFKDEPGISKKTIKIPVEVTGVALDKDREFKIIALSKDSVKIDRATEKFKACAKSNQYVIGKGIVEAGKYTGYAEIEINNTSELADSVYAVMYTIIPTEDFPETLLTLRNSLYLELSFSDRLIQPANWRWLKWYFGDYSTSWWNYIREVTGRKSLPYFPDHEDEGWDMSSGELQAYQALVRLALDNYNASHLTPMTHDDGAKAGEEISMP